MRTNMCTSHLVGSPPRSQKERIPAFASSSRAYPSDACNSLLNSPPHGDDTGARSRSRMSASRGSVSDANCPPFSGMQHYLWAGGHFVLLISSVRYLLAWILFRSPGAGWYKGTPLVSCLPPTTALSRTSLPRCSQFPRGAPKLRDRLPVSALRVESNVPPILNSIA